MDFYMIFIRIYKIVGYRILTIFNGTFLFIGQVELIACRFVLSEVE